MPHLWSEFYLPLHRLPGSAFDIYVSMSVFCKCTQKPAIHTYCLRWINKCIKILFRRSHLLLPARNNRGWIRGDYGGREGSTEFLCDGNRAGVSSGRTGEDIEGFPNVTMISFSVFQCSAVLCVPTLLYVHLATLEEWTLCSIVRVGKKARGLSSDAFAFVFVSWKLHFVRWKWRCYRSLRGMWWKCAVSTKPNQNQHVWFLWTPLLVSL